MPLSRRRKGNFRPERDIMYGVRYAGKRLVLAQNGFGLSDWVARRIPSLG